MAVWLAWGHETMCRLLDDLFSIDGNTHRMLQAAQNNEDANSHEHDEHVHYSHRAPWLRAFILGANDGLVGTQLACAGGTASGGATCSCSCSLGLALLTKHVLVRGVEGRGGGPGWWWRAGLRRVVPSTARAVE